MLAKLALVTHFFNLAAGISPLYAFQPKPWSDRKMSPDARAQALMKSMTYDEKANMLSGCAGCPYVGVVQGNTRLGIPPLYMQDGPQGFRTTSYPGTTIAWPSGLTVAASWDTEAMYEWGEAMGKEYRAKGSNVQLGPGMNLARVPENGRNFEYMASEDPYLGYSLAKFLVKGIQSQKVIATAKHYVLNSEETFRNGASENADERTRFEMYYPPFQGAVDAGVGSVMCSYNKVYNTFACENPEILQRDLKERMGFQGFVMSDWGATHSPSLVAGLDMEMPAGGIMKKESLMAAKVPEWAVDRSAFNILRAMFSVGIMDEPLSAWDPAMLQANTVTASSLDLARRLSAESTVLLKNEGGLLPLKQNQKIVVIGFGSENAITHGAGSGDVAASRLITPIEGIRKAAGKAAHVTYADTNMSKAFEHLKDADYAIIFVGASATEMMDRHSLSLDAGCTEYLMINTGMTLMKQGGDIKPSCLGVNPFFSSMQNKAVLDVAKAKPGKTIVVASVPGAVLMPWSTNVPAILTNFLPGQEVGYAIADVLFGNVNPSAKLPVTFPNDETEITTGLARSEVQTLAKTKATFEYTEKLLVGYRQYDRKHLNFTTGFPFGHGLSYTTFEYSNLDVSDKKVSFVLRNIGNAVGKEVAQLYLAFPAAAGEPPQQLKNFYKTKLLAPGEVQHVVMELLPRDFSIWSTAVHDWELVSGQFQVRIGSSSRDIRLLGTLTV